MQTADYVVDITIPQRPTVTRRAELVSSLFDVPLTDAPALKWSGKLPLSEREWQIGLIVGPSGCGKTTIARETFGLTPTPTWSDASLIDDFAPELSIEAIQRALSSVGLNTIPAWLRPHAVLSNGERFRADLARLILENDVCIVDEFSSVVDRQVARVASHAVQRYVRSAGKRFVAVSCHGDIIDWLQPDWVLRPDSMAFTWRSVQRRPRLELRIQRAHHSDWRLFHRYHYLTSDHHRAARCFMATVDGTPVGWCSLLHFPHPRCRDIVREHRTVVLPDWQGLGVAHHLTASVAAIAAVAGYRFRSYPSHPAYVRSRVKDARWRLIRPRQRSLATGRTSSRRSAQKGRWSAVFEWRGGYWPDPAMALRLWGGA